MTTFLSVLATFALTTLAVWTLGSRALRTIGGLLILAALVDIALADWPFASDLMLMTGLTAWLAGHMYYAHRHHRYANRLAERVLQSLERWLGPLMRR